MYEGKCERCSEPRQEHEWCAHCQIRLCNRCVANGCCGRTPARRGYVDEHGRERTEK